MQKQLLTSKSEHWCTPEHILDRVRRIDAIGLDPCPNVFSKVNPKKALTSQDGLQVSWQGKGLVFVNPPYGRKVSQWCRKMAFEASRGVEIVALLPARVDTKWCHDLVWDSAIVVHFYKGRLKFVDGTTGVEGDPAPFPSMLVYWGNRADKFIDAFDDTGHWFFP